MPNAECQMPNRNTMQNAEVQMPNETEKTLDTAIGDVLAFLLGIWQSAFGIVFSVIRRVDADEACGDADVLVGAGEGAGNIGGTGAV